MITYEFKCGHDHLTEKQFSINTCPSSIVCPECGEDAPKIFSLNANRPIGLPTKVHHKTGATNRGHGPIDLGEIG